MSLPAWWKHPKNYAIMDCIEGMRGIPDGSVDLIVTDPPYYRIMLHDWRGEKFDWDNQWKTMQDYLGWVETWGRELKRILKHNGSIYLFADDKNASRVHILFEDMGLFLENHIVWYKPNNMTNKGWNGLNSYAAATERILFFSKEQRTHNLENVFYAETVKAFAPIIEYMIEQKKRVKILKGFKTDEEFNEYINSLTGTKSVVSRHYFTYSQWCFPTEELYKKLQSINLEVFRKEYEVFRKEYEVLRKEYEVLRKEYEGLLRPFHPAENYADVWTFNITSTYEDVGHPTAKPTPLLERIINTSTNPGDIVLDPFLGSGTTLLACRKTDRIGLGFEINPECASIIEKRSMEKIPNIETFFGGDSP